MLYNITCYTLRFSIELLIMYITTKSQNIHIVRDGKKHPPSAQSNKLLHVDPRR